MPYPPQPDDDTPTHRITAVPASENAHLSGYLAAPSPRWAMLSEGCAFHLLRNAHTPLTYVPFATPQLTLDLGCGMGRWALAYRQHYPTALVVALDRKVPTSAIPEGSGVRFAQVDLTQPLPVATATVDHVHIRFLALDLPLLAWLPLLRESLRVLKPGGWLELQELGMPRISHPMPWMWIARYARTQGVELFPGNVLVKWLEQVGGTGIAQAELAVQRNADPAASARMIIRDGIALLAMFRDALLESHIATPEAFDREFREMQRNVFVADRHDTIIVHTAICQRG